MPEFVWRVGCSCGWKGPVRSLSEKALLRHDASWHALEIKRPDFHQMVKMRAVVTFEPVQR